MTDRWDELGDEFLGTTPYALQDLVVPQATEEGRALEVPERFSAARARFDTARAAFHAGRYGEAAAGFLDAARVLPRGGPAALAATLAADRVAAYRNAAHALVLAGDAAEARAALAPFIREDPSCADALRAILESLPAPSRPPRRTE